MARFILIDHSLKGIGGHHFEYAVHMLQAAEAAGFEIVLATHRRFRDRHRLPQTWRVLRLFPHHTYCRYSMQSEACDRPFDLHQRRGGPVRGPWRQRLALAWHRRLQCRRVDRFAMTCARLFRQLDLHADDHVFLPTLSEFDLVGLIQFLKTDCRTLAVDWHLQFHFNFLAGRPPEYQRQQNRITVLKRHCEEILGEVPEHRLHFYSTTLPMADQYNRLGVAPFRVLPYPVNTAHHAEAPDRPRGFPLRITCAGGIRAEKGQQQLAPLVHALWEDLFASGRVQLLVQSKKSRFRLARPGEKHAEVPMGRWPAATKAPLVDVPHPLDMDGYARLIRGTHIGLFLYDSRRYYARCAGPLVEMLAAGVPVIVPAGCWLAEQIAEPIWRHIDRLREVWPAVGDRDARTAAWQSGGERQMLIGGADRPLVLGRTGATLETDLDVPAGATHLMVSFQWLRPTEPGTYIRCQTRSVGRAGAGQAEFATTVGHRAEGRPVRALIPLQPSVATVRLVLSNAYDETPIALGDIRLRFFSAAAAPSGTCPAGAVGLIAADPRQIPALLREMVRHYAHYRQSAMTFARRWRAIHDPGRDIAILTRSETAAAERRTGARAA